MNVHLHTDPAPARVTVSLSAPQIVVLRIGARCCIHSASALLGRCCYPGSVSLEKLPRPRWTKDAVSSRVSNPRQPGSTQNLLSFTVVPVGAQGIPCGIGKVKDKAFLLSDLRRSGRGALQWVHTCEIKILHRVSKSRSPLIPEQMLRCSESLSGFGPLTVLTSYFDCFCFWSVTCSMDMVTDCTVLLVDVFK